MPRRKKVAMLPKALRDELDRKLIEGAFCGYEDMAQWISDMGHAISKSALHRHGSDLEGRVERIRLATEQAEALVATTPDDMSALADAGIRMIQEQMFTALSASEEGDMVSLARSMRALAESVRATVTLRKDQRGVLEKATEKAVAAVRRTNASPQTIAAMRAALRGEDDTENAS